MKTFKPAKPFENCPKCGELVYYLITKTKKFIPVNADTISDDDKIAIALADQVKQFDPVHQGHINHCLTCKNKSQTKSIISPSLKE